VEVVAEGEEEMLLRLLTHLRRGPRGAWVEKVETTWGPATGKYRRFGVRF
jgi:acylphosphatase